MSYSSKKKMFDCNKNLQYDSDALLIKLNLERKSINTFSVLPSICFENSYL